MANIHYLSIIRKADFIDLFKYGYRNIFDRTEFDGDLKTHEDDQELFDRLTQNMNMFEYSFEYLIIHYILDEQTEYTVQLQDVLGVYTFNEEAKSEMSISFDPRIQLHVSPWADKFVSLQKKLFVKQSMRGVDNLWAIFDLPKENIAKCDSIITSDIITEVFRQLYEYQRPSGEQSIWTYLLRYERHSFYPQNIKGFFCDFIHVVCNWKNQKEIDGDVAEKTALYPKIAKCTENDFKSLSEIVNKSQIATLTEKEADCRFAIAAPLFLYLKHTFKDGINKKPDEKVISYAKEVGGFECFLAIYLLGITLGYDKTYDGFYDVVQPPILKAKMKKQSQSSIPSKNNGEAEGATDKVGFSEKNDSNTSQMDNSNKHAEEQMESQDEKPEPIAWMRPKKGDIYPVFSDKEKQKEIANGAKEIERFSKKDKEFIKNYKIKDGYIK